jgi:hypothetical protein
MGSTVISICLTIYFTFAQGFLHFSSGLGTSLSLLVILCTLYGIHVRKYGFCRGIAAEALLVALLICSLSLRSNTLVTTASSLTILFSFLLLGIRNTTHSWESGVDTLLISSAQYSKSFTCKFITTIKTFLSLEWLKLSKSGALSIIVSAPFLALFHYLFSRVNPSYAEFVTLILTTVFSMNVFIYAFEILVQFAFLQALFSSEDLPTISHEVSIQRYKPVSLALLPLCGMFVLFSLFQSTAIAQIEITSEFQALSHYVQRGFWELVWIGVIGCICWLAVFLRGENISQLLTTRRVTGLFAALCVLVGAFTLHKVGLLQLLFGYKDHRIYATALTCNLMVVLAGACVISFRSTPFKRVFTTCRVSLLITAAILALLNVDLLCSSINPIRFRVDGVEKKDYSYLLGNSFDNTQVWESLMTEVISEGVKIPEGYYWGSYRPLCLYYPSTQRVDLVIKTHFDSLIEKYSTPTKSVLDYIDFNIAEYRAYSWLLSHSNLLEQFYERVRSDCSIAAKYYSQNLSNFSINGY